MPDLDGLIREYETRFGVPCPMPAPSLGGLREAIETALETGSPIPADWDPYADLPDDAVA